MKQTLCSPLQEAGLWHGEKAEGEGSADGWCGERGGNLLPSGGRGDDVVSGPTWGCQAPSGARWPLPPGLTCSPVTRQERREKRERRGKRRRALIRAETGAWWPDTLLNTAGIKTWGGFVRTQQRQWGSQSLPRPITHCLHQRHNKNTLKHSHRESSALCEPIGIQESSMKSIWHNDGREAPANTAQRQIVEKGQDQIKAP